MIQQHFTRTSMGQVFTCPNSELNYTYDDDYGGGNVTICVTNGLIFDQVNNIFATCWTFYEGDVNATSLPIRLKNFKVKWNNSALGTIGNIHIDVCDNVFTFICSSGNRGVTFGPSPGSPVISGSSSLLNCISQQQSYTPVNIPESWQLVGWNFSSNIQQVSSTLNPKTIQATSTTSNGAATLTGVFNFVTGGNTCATQTVNKSIWLGEAWHGESSG
jgi:hypothetical protein